MAAPTPITSEILVNLGNTNNYQGEANLVRLNDGFLALYSNGGGTIMGQRYDIAGQTVGSSFTVTNNANANAPSGVQMADGTLVLGYYNGNGAVVARFDASGTRLGADVVLATNSSAPNLTVLANGNFVACWHGTDGQGRVQIFNSSGFALTSVLDKPNAGAADVSEFIPLEDGFSNSGFVVASWDPFSGTGVGVTTYDSAGTATSNFLIEGSGNQAHAVTVLSNDRFVVLHGTTGQTGLYATIYNQNGTVAQAAQLVSNTSGSMRAYDATALSDGGFVLLWEGADTNGSGTYARRYDALGNPDGAEFLVNLSTLGTQTPRWNGIIELPNGDIAIGWHGYSEVNGSVIDHEGALVRLFDVPDNIVSGLAPTALTGETLVNTTTAGFQAGPSLIQLADGYLAVWQDAGASIGLRGQRYDNAGNAVGVEVTLSTGLEASASGVQLVDGTVVLAFSNGTGGVSVARFDANGVRISGNTDVVIEVNGSNPNVTLLANGRYAISWHETGDHAKAQVFNADGTAFSGVLTVNSSTSREASPLIDAFSDGGVVIVSWDPFDGSGVHIQRYSPTGVAQGGTVQLAGDGGRDHALAVLADDSFVVVHGNPSDPGIYYTIFAADGTVLRAESLVSAQSSSFPQRAHDAVALRDGGFVLLWSAGGGSDGASTGTYMRRFDADGSPLGIAVLVNQTTANNQVPTYNSLIELSNGDLAVSWQGNGAGDDQGAFMRVFDLPIDPSSNAAPLITSNGGGDSASVSVDESSLAVTTVVATDPNMTTPFFTITGGADAALFTIDMDTGALSFRTAPNFEAPTDFGTNNGYEVVVTASDGSLTDSQTITVSVTNINETPTITSSGGGATASVSVAENTTAVTTVTATDPDLTSPTFSITGGEDAALFQIDAATGALSFRTAPNFEAPTDAGTNNGYEVVVTASDGSLTDSQTITVSVTNTNETPTITSSGGGATASVSVAENATAVTTVTATDPDLATPAFSITGGTDAALFQIDAATGALSFRTAPNFEAPTDAGTNNGYEVVVTASDGSLTDSQTITVSVTDTNETPTITSSGGGATASVSVAENTTAVTTVTATDPDLTSPTFSINGGADAALFQIDTATGALSFRTAPNFEAPTDAGTNNGYEVVVTASDGSLTDSQTITVSVTGANEAPTITSNSGGATASVSVAENTTAVTTVIATDPDLTTPAYSITGGADAALFQIDAATGALSFRTAPNFEAPTDFGTNNGYEVVVTASDGSLTDSQTITVSVTNTNESPTITSNGGGATASVSVAENTTAVTTVIATDPDLTTPAYSITGVADAALFQIDAATGALSFVSAPNFEAPTDAGTNNGYEVVVTASDGSLTDSQTITVSVTDANEDVTAPSVIITDNVASIANINGGAVRFLLTFSEAVTGLALSDFTVTGGTVLGLTPDVGSDGSQYVLEVMPSTNSTSPIEITLGANAAQDASGNGSPLTTASQAVDTVAPAAPSAFVLLGSSNSGDPRDTITSNRTPTIAATVESGATVLLRDSTGTIIGTVQASPEGHAPFTLATLADGTHSYTAQVVDVAGNAGPLSTVLVLTIDTVAPTVSAPVIEGISGADTIVGASEAEGGVSISVTIDGAPVNVTIGGRAATQNGNTWTSVLTAVDGLNSFTIRAFDAAGNTATQSHSFTADLDLTGPADNDTLTGGDGGDTVATGIGDDVVTLGAGDDTFDGGAGNDLVFGGDGRDELDGNTGNDTMLGGAGNDSYFVDSLQDRVYETTSIRGSADAGGVDTVFSSVSFNLDAYAGVRFVERLTLTGSDAINGTGNALDNILTGNNAANVLNGGRGNDTMLGGAGNDIFVVNADGDRVYETTTTTSGVDAGGTDLVQSAVTFSLAAAVGTSFVENLSLIGQARVNATGNALDNSVTGNSAANVLDGGAGHDTLNGAGGNDTMLGGAGNDVFIVGAARDQVFETTTTASTLDAGGVDRVESAVTFSLAATVGVSFVENLTLTGRGNISGTGNGLSNVLLGNTGANTLSGGDGNDTLDGGAGDDRMIGGAGNDLYIVTSARDRVFETTSVTGTLDAGGQDTIQSAVSQDLNAYLGLRFVEVLHLTGTGNINGLGNSLGNVLHGNSGNNLLDGGAGVDTMLGGAGNDTYVVESTDDLIFETTTTTSGIDAGGIDTVRTSVSYNLGNGAGLQFVENLTLTGSGNVDGRGNGLDNVLTGNAGNNLLDGGAGADTMIGGAGSDIYVVNNAGDRVFETTTSANTVNAGGTDTVQSSVSFSLDASVGVRFVENLYLTGTGAINGTGNALANTLIGNSGDNLLNGGLGVDMLIGGAGADGFVFNTVLSTANIDRIVDFTSGEDVIRLDTTLFLGLDLGAQGADAVSVNGTITADTRLIYEAATGRLFYDADGAGSDAAVHFVTLTAGLTLAADDFFVF